MARAGAYEGGMTVKVDRALGGAVVIATVPARVYDRAADTLYRAGADLVLCGRGYDLVHGGDWPRAERVAEVLEGFRKARKGRKAR